MEKLINKETNIVYAITDNKIHEWKELKFIATDFINTSIKVYSKNYNGYQLFIPYKNNLYIKVEMTIKNNSYIKNNIVLVKKNSEKITPQTHTELKKIFENDEVKQNQPQTYYDNVYKGYYIKLIKTSKELRLLNY